MTDLQIINLVLARLGRVENNAYLKAQAIMELQLIIERLEHGAFMPWFLLSGEDTTLMTVANQRYVDLPSGFLREYEDFPLYRYDSTANDSYIRLIKDEFDVLESRFGGEGAAVPTHYALVGTQLQMFVTPDDAYPLRWNYYRSDTQTLDGTGQTNNWTSNAADKLVGELGFVMAGYRRDKGMQELFSTEIIRADARLLAFDEARKQALRDAYRGDKD